LKIYREIKEFKVQNPVLTVGTFDGVHLGHRKILDVLVKEAEKINGEPVVLTLYPHPRKILDPTFKDLFLLNTLDEKAKLLENAGIKHLIIYPFTKDFASLSSCDFIEKILFNKLNVRKLIVGYDHHFGKDRQGNIDILRNCALPFNIDVLKVDAFTLNNKKVSSTTIRNALLSGEIENTNTCLGYDYFISGKVISGSKIGRTIGFPTANIEVHKEKLIPRKGVYAVKILISDKEYTGMLNIGSRPTVDTSNQLVVETHIFDFEGDLYDKSIKICFKHFIREEQKFPDKEALKQRLLNDKKQTQILFQIQK